MEMLIFILNNSALEQFAIKTEAISGDVPVAVLNRKLLQHRYLNGGTLIKGS